MSWLKRLFGSSAHSRDEAKKLNDVAVRFLQNDQTAQASAAFQQAVAADPTWSVSHLNYARFLYVQKKYGESACYLELAKTNARSGTDPSNDSRVLRDADLLEGGLSAHGVGKGTQRHMVIVEDARLSGHGDWVLAQTSPQMAESSLRATIPAL